MNGATLKQVEKFKYLGVAFTSDERQDKELDTRIRKASAVMRALHDSVVMKRKLLKKAKLSIFNKTVVIVITFYSPHCLGQETAKRPFGLRVKLPPAHLSTTRGGGFTLSV